MGRTFPTLEGKNLERKNTEKEDSIGGPSWNGSELELNEVPKPG